MARQREEEFLTKIQAQLRRCHGFEGDTVEKARKQALDYYFQRARGDEVTGRSHVVSGDVSAMVEAVMAAMMDSFTSDRIAEFDALGAQDEDQAQLESDAVQYFIMQRGNGKLQLRQAIKDALLLRNGVLKVYVETKDTKHTRVLTNVTPEAYAGLDNVDSYDEDSQEATQSETVTTKKLKSEAVPIENFFYVADWDRHDLQDIPFCAERHVGTRSELVELFPKKKKAIAGLQKHSFDDSVAGNARNPRNQSTYMTGVDDSQDAIEWYECYVLADRDNDGISERRKVCFSGQTILDDYPVQLVPYAAGTAIINPHRFLGISLFDKLKQVQDEHTGLKRMRMDSLNTTVKNRVAYLDGRVNVDDVSDGRPNGAIRVNANVGDIRQAIMPFDVLDTTGNINANIEAIKQERSEMGGAALDMQAANVQIGGDGMGSMGLDRAYSVQEQLAADQTDTIASTLIRSWYLLAHATMRENFDEPLDIKVNGRWTQAKPSQWPARESVTIKPGMSVGERQRRQNTLRTVITDQVALSEMGMDDVLVDVDKFYNVFMDWLRVSDIAHPEQYFIDPTTEAARKAAAQKQQKAQQAEQMKNALMQDAVALEKLREAINKYKHDSELAFKYWAESLGAEIEEAKIAGPAVADLMKTRLEGNAQVDEFNSRAESPRATGTDN